LERISSGANGFDVAFDRVIEQPGRAERREHYTWHYTMLPNHVLVGSLPAPPTTPPKTSTSVAPTTSKPKSTTSAPRTTTSVPRP